MWFWYIWEVFVYYLWNGDRSNCCIGLLLGINEIMYVKCLEKWYVYGKSFMSVSVFLLGRLIGYLF